MLAAVALANKMARVVWKLMVSGERYNPPSPGSRDDQGINEFGARATVVRAEAGSLLETEQMV